MSAAAAMLHDQHLPLPFHNPNSTCDRHPDVPVTGFCASCLRERLQHLETTRGRPARPTTSSAIRSIFSRNHHHHPPSSSLRRCNSFSAAGPRDAVTASAFEPLRRSCDARGRNTLWSLIHQEQQEQGSDARRPVSGGTECRNAGLGLGSCSPPPPQLQLQRHQDDNMNADELVPDRTQPHVPIREDDEVDGNASGRTREMVNATKEHGDDDDDDIRTNHGKRASSSKDLKEMAGSFWVAASVFSKKLQNWRRKQKLKKQRQQGAMQHRTENVPGTRPRRLLETQSEVGLELLGRRMSCDIDPRFSLDGGRLSFDDARGSWDEPRASWDGYLFGGRSVFSSRLPSMLEDVCVPGVVQRSDGLIPVEEDVRTPGGTAQTREYYTETWQRRRRSLDRCSSGKRRAANEVEDARAGATKSQSAHVNGEHRVERQDDGFDHPKGGGPPPWKKSRLWSKAWNLWGFIQRRSGARNAAGGVERSMSECWTELRVTAGDGGVRRSNSSLSSRYSPNTPSGSLPSLSAMGRRKGGMCTVEAYGRSMGGPGWGWAGQEPPAQKRDAAVLKP